MKSLKALDFIGIRTAKITIMNLQIRILIQDSPILCGHPAFLGTFAKRLRANRRSFSLPSLPLFIMQAWSTDGRAMRMPMPSPARSRPSWASNVVTTAKWKIDPPYSTIDTIVC